MLKALVRWLWPTDAPATRKGRDGEHVTREQVQEMIEDSAKDLVYEWNEWYEKFDKLHLRLAKRAAREEKKSRAVEDDHNGVEQGGDSRPGVLALRRFGSV